MSKYFLASYILLHVLRHLYIRRLKYCIMLMAILYTRMFDRSAWQTGKSTNTAVAVVVVVVAFCVNQSCGLSEKMIRPVF